jgi:hypothetical protein
MPQREKHETSNGRAKNESVDAQAIAWLER